MIRRAKQIMLTLLLVLIIFTAGLRIVKAEEAAEEEADAVQEKVQQALLEEFELIPPGGVL